MWNNYNDNNKTLKQNGDMIQNDRIHAMGELPWDAILQWFDKGWNVLQNSGNFMMRWM